MANIVRQYKIDFPENASQKARGKIYARLDKMGLLCSASIQTERSGPFGLEYSRKIDYIMVTTLNDMEDAIFKREVSSEGCFSICTLTQTK